MFFGDVYLFSPSFSPLFSSSRLKHLKSPRVSTPWCRVLVHEETDSETRFVIQIQSCCSPTFLLFSKTDGYGCRIHWVRFSCCGTAETLKGIKNKRVKEIRTSWVGIQPQKNNCVGAKIQVENNRFGWLNIIVSNHCKVDILSSLMHNMKLSWKRPKIHILLNLK